VVCLKDKEFNKWVSEAISRSHVKVEKTILPHPQPGRCMNYVNKLARILKKNIKLRQ